MKKLLVTWTTEETIEWTREIEVPDDFDPDSLDGDSDELIEQEKPGEGDLMSFERIVDSVDEVEP